jgi:hypothetical protein
MGLCMGVRGSDELPTWAYYQHCDHVGNTVTLWPVAKMAYTMPYAGVRNIMLHARCSEIWLHSQSVTVLAVGRSATQPIWSGDQIREVECTAGNGTNPETPCWTHAVVSCTHNVVPSFV